MFADSFVATMTVQVLFFVGLVVMFFSLSRSISAQREEMREAVRKQQLYLADIERQMMEINFVLRRLQGGEAEPVKAAGQGETGIPGLKSRDELLSILEKASGAGDAETPIGDLRLPPPAVSRPLAEEYDPSHDPHLFDDPLLPPSLGRFGGGREETDADRLRLPPLRRSGR
ncbi:MAG: hypothetical protein LBU06_04040 [Desulfovibrio sp.]|jgi:hypothetical protein|nr:hypothetical protein [Desulfovibrio sp.]